MGCVVEFLEIFSSELAKDGSYIDGFVLQVAEISEVE